MTSALRRLLFFRRRGVRRVVLGRAVAARLAAAGVAHFRLVLDALAAGDQDVALEPRPRRAVRIDEAELLGALLVIGDDDPDDAAILQAAEQDLVGERRLDRALD